VQGTVIAFQRLLLCGQPAEGGRDLLNHSTGETVPSENQGGTLPSDQLSELPGKKNNVQNGLGGVEVQIGKRGRPLLCVVSETLVGVANAVVEVANFVVVHIPEVVVVEMVGQSAAESQGHLLVVVVNGGVDHRTWQGKQEKHKNLNQLIVGALLV